MNHLNLIITIYFDNILVKAHYWWENFISADNNLQTVSLFNHEKVKLLIIAWDLYSVKSAVSWIFSLIQITCSQNVAVTISCLVDNFVFCFFFFFSHNSNCFWNHQTLIVLIKQFKNHFSLRVDWQKKCLQFYKTNFRPDKMIKLVSKFLFKILNFKQHISTNNLSNFYSAWRKLLILLLMHNCNTFWTFKHLQNTFFFIAFQQHKATLQSTNI